MFNRHNDGDIVSKKNKFLYLIIKWNDGLGFSILRGRYITICIMQFIFIILQILILNFCNNKIN